MSDSGILALAGIATVLIQTIGVLILALINRKSNVIITKADEAKADSMEVAKKTDIIQQKVDGNLTKMQAELESSRKELSAYKSQIESYHHLVEELIKAQPKLQVSPITSPGGRRAEDIGKKE